jgi:hypothetical protein
MMTDFQEAIDYAEGLYDYCKASGMPAELARYTSDGWLNSFNALYLISTKAAIAVEYIDRMLEILRLDVPFIEKHRKLIELDKEFKASGERK